jgi:hypothetical protein
LIEPARPANASHLPRLRTPLAAVLALALCACDGLGGADGNKTAAAPAPCLPEGEPAPLATGGQAPAPARAAAAPRIYLDGSMSMAGYVDPALGRTQALADVISLAAREYPEAEFIDFGTGFHPIADAAEARRYTTPAPYTCRTPECDVQESAIDAALERIAGDSADRLNILISDLWLDNRSHRESVEVALGTPLRRILESGRAIGVIGIRAPFKGPIYTATAGVATYQGASERPLFLIAAGPDAAVQRLYRALADAQSPALSKDRLRFSLFSTALPDPAAQPQLAVQGAGIAKWPTRLASGAATLPAYRIDRPRAQSLRGSLGAELDPAEGLPAGLVWSGEPFRSTQVWQLTGQEDLSRCSAGMWTRVVPLRDPWAEAQDGRARFSITPQAVARLNPGTYYVAAELGATGLKANGGETGWMREWSVSEEGLPAFVASRPAQFKALKLDRLGTILESQLAARLQGQRRTTRRFALILKVEQ